MKWLLLLLLAPAPEPWSIRQDADGTYSLWDNGKREMRGMTPLAFAEGVCDECNRRGTGWDRKLQWWEQIREWDELMAKVLEEQDNPRLYEWHPFDPARDERQKKRREKP